MNMKFAKVAVIAAVSMSAMMVFTACDETTAGAQGVAGAQGEPGANGKDGRDGKDGVSCTAKEISDGSGYTISCGGEYVGVLLNGKDGKKGDDGKDGASCSATILADSTGYALICDNKMVGTIKNGVNGLQGIQGIQGERGEKGQDGSSCTVVDTTDSKTERTGYKLLCADTLKGVVWNGLDGEQGDKGDDGESCTVKAVTDGYDVYCGGVKTGSLKNGKDGIISNISELFDLDFYNKMFLGQEGSGLSWKAADGAILESGVMTAKWQHFTDTMGIHATSGFDFEAPWGLADAKGWAEYTDEQIKNIGAAGGKVVKAAKSYVDFYFRFRDVLPVSDMLGLCLEYESDQEDLQMGIKYKGEDDNNYARPFFQLSPTTEHSITLNIPWGAFNKSNDWGTVEAGVADVIKVMTGVSFKSHNGTEKTQTGVIKVYKLGAYGTCE